MKTTYKVSWPCGCSKYFKNKSAARVFHDYACPICDTDSRAAATQLSKVTLTPDAFERAANGDGGYEADETIL